MVLFPPCDVIVLDEVLIVFCFVCNRMDRTRHGVASGCRTCAARTPTPSPPPPSNGSGSVICFSHQHGEYVVVAAKLAVLNAAAAIVIIVVF